MAGTPAESVQAFGEAVRERDFAAAWARVAKFEGVAEEGLRVLKDEFRRQLKETPVGWKLHIVDGKVSGECAVVAIEVAGGRKGRDGPEFEPVYLLMQEGEWRVFPDLTYRKIAESIDGGMVPVFTALDEWFEERKATHKGEREREDKAE